MSKRQRRERQRRQRHDRKRRKLLTAEQRAHAPQLIAASLVTVGLVTQALTSTPCDAACANSNGGGAAALLPSNFDIDTVPTRANYTHVISVPIASAGTVAMPPRRPTPFRT